MANTVQFPGTVDQIENTFNKMNEIRASATHEQYPSALAVLNFVYPIGCLYWSRISTPPSELFGGTWNQIQGKVVVAAGTYTDKNGEERTFEVGNSDNGEFSHTLKVEEIPSHNHDRILTLANTYEITYRNAQELEKGQSAAIGAKKAEEAYPTGHTAICTDFKGGNQPHNNMPPYEVFYCWERIA